MIDVSKNLDNVFLDGDSSELEVVHDPVVAAEELDLNAVETIGREELMERTSSENEELHKDYEETRKIYDELIAAGKKAVSQLAYIADETDSARAFEVLGTLIKNTKEVAEQKLDLHLKMKKIKEDNSAKSITNNAIFVGSTEDLQRMLKKTKLKEIADTKG